MTDIRFTLKSLAAIATACLFFLISLENIAEQKKKSASPAEVAPTVAASAEQLREATWRLERLLRENLRRAAEPHQSGRDLLPSSDELRARLLRLRRETERIEGPQGMEWRRKILALSPLLWALERADSGVALTNKVGKLWRPMDLHEARIIAPSDHSRCSEALLTDEGLFVSTLTEGEPNELWLRYQAATAGLLAASTAGSSFDTVLEAYRSCPTAAGDHPLARGDDEIGLQARIGFPIAADETVWIRVRGWETAVGSLALFLTSGPTGGLSGGLTQEATGEPLISERVVLWDSSGFYVTTSFTDSGGVYTFLGIEAGTYFVSTALYNENMLDELYGDLPCPGGAPSGCDSVEGTPVVVIAGELIQGIDFVLGSGASVSGRIRDAATKLPLDSIRVEIFGPSGELLGDTLTDVTGRYKVNALGNGHVFAVALDNFSFGDHAPELYQDLPCPSSCDPTLGMPIPVQIGFTTAGIDFDLELAGAIEGTLTQAVGGAPIAFEQIRIYDMSGSLRRSVSTDSQGRYRSGGLDPDTYFVATETSGAFSDELYNDFPCLSSCDPTTGSPVLVNLGTVTSGIDFELNRQPIVSGAVTDAVSGQPLYNLRVELWNSSGGYEEVEGTDSLGRYSFLPVLPGTYFVTVNGSKYQGKLYDDLVCEPSCDVTKGTPVVAQLDMDVTGVDLTLTPLGAISGSITETGSGASLPSFVIKVWNAAGQPVAQNTFGSTVEYRIEGLEAGTYYVSATASTHLGELHNDIPCADGPPGCDPTSGTPIVVTLNTTTVGVDFELDSKGSIAGVVREAPSGRPIFASIEVYDATGVSVGGGSSDSSGAYKLEGLNAGSYFVAAAAFGHGTQLYDGIPCYLTSCDLTAGTPIPVNLGEITTDIDFELPSDGHIAGQITSMAGGPISSTWISIYNAAGNPVAFFLSSHIYGWDVEPGTYFVQAEGDGFASQLYDAIPCPDPCDVTGGTPVVILPDATTTGIDFQLEPTRGIVGRVTRVLTGSPLEGTAIDLWSTAGTLVGSTVTGVEGFYHFDSGSGTYFISTDNGLGGLDELWKDISCLLGPAFEGLCDPLTGSPVVLPTSDSLVTGIDFSLQFSEIFWDGFESGDLSTWTVKVP